MKNVLLIDAHSLIHRCYHALPQFTNKAGEPTGALYGLSSVLLKIMHQVRPDYAVALFDRPEPTFRKERFEAYKAHRPKADDELVSQLIRARDLFAAFSITVVEKPGYEADDLIGTLATKFKKEKDVRVTIFTGDLDSLQLVENNQVVVETFKKGISETVVYTEEKVREKLGVFPHQVVDYKALVGDQSDNIPGVAGIGPKTASSILEKYKTLQDFFTKGQKEKSYEKIFLQKNNALLSQELAQIDCNVPIETSIHDIVFHPDTSSIEAFFLKNDFSSLLKRIGKESSRQEDNPAPTPQPSPPPTPKNVVVIDEHTKAPTLSSSHIKIGYNLKPYLHTHNIQTPYVDVYIGLLLLEHREASWEKTSTSLFGSEMNKKEFILRAYQWMTPLLSEKGLLSIFEEIEMPLLPVLARMEQRGIAIDRQALQKVKKDISADLAQTEKTLRKQIGKDINPNSPKQVLEYLQQQGARISSTAADKLEKIADNFPVVKDIMAYREIFKLKTTYIDAFEKITANDDRIHPTFLQIGAATGRLSCHEPNLQNIPQESKWASAIRNVFQAPQNHSLVSFDYSQIELRVLASLSQDPTLINAFQNREDIHSLTAQKIFGIPEKEAVSYQQRRTAKTLNFGIIYGMGSRSFAQQSGLSTQEAKRFIEKYFEEFSTVKDWQQSVLQEARRKGYVQNKNGRIRTVEGIHAAHQRFASEAERIAINMPLQSLAADILKIAMIRVSKQLTKPAYKDVHMILTIHDELLFEIPNNLLQDEKESEVINVIRSAMENAYKLLVPLRVDVMMGARWGEMK